MRMSREELEKDPGLLSDVAQAFREAGPAFEYLSALCDDAKFRASMEILEGTVTPELIASKQAELRGIGAWREIVESVLGLFENKAEEVQTRERMRSIGAPMA